MLKLLPLVAGAFASLVATQTATAQTDEAVNREAREIFETVLSPYCPGRTISNCPSPQAEDLRASIKEQLASGASSDEVKEELYAVFGDELRTIPRARGFGLLAWIVPGLGFLGGAWAITIWMRRTKGEQTRAPEPAPIELDPEAESRLKAELAELESSI